MAAESSLWDYRLRSGAAPAGILLPDRERSTAAARLANHREIAIVARDRGGGYGEAVARAPPNAFLLAAIAQNLRKMAKLVRPPPPEGRLEAIA